MKLRQTSATWVYAHLPTEVKKITNEIVMNADDREYTKEELDNHANQLNENNDAYWQSRGESGRPEDEDD